MKVRCITTLISNPNEALLRSGWWGADHYLTIGKDYVVFAIYASYFGDVDAYLICDDHYDDHKYYWPLFVPASYFVIINNNKHSSWVASQIDPRYEGPPELGPGKYETLLNGDHTALEHFRYIRRILTSDDE